MISLTRLLGGSFSFSDPCADELPDASGVTVPSGPVVSWLATRTCNLECNHCHVEAARKRFPGELSRDEAAALIDDLATIDTPAFVITGGEPLVRADIPSLIERATARGIRTVLATNGTLVDARMARKLAGTGVDSVRISIDGTEPTHDRFRGRKGAWKEAIAGIRHAREQGLRVTLRFTVTGDNVDELDDVYRLVEDEGIPHLVIQHLVYAGSGAFLSAIDLDVLEKREMMDGLLRQVDAWNDEGRSVEVHTSESDCDGPFVCMWLLENDSSTSVRERLRSLHGNRSGERSVVIDSVGEVFPDRHLRSRPLGNVRERRLSEIWSDSTLTHLVDLRRRRDLIHGRCADCSWIHQCNGGSRARAESESGGDPWASDPGCYLLDEEITERRSIRAMAAP